MPDIQSLHLALGAMTQKERDDFLGKALSQQPVESQDAILQLLDLKELPANSRVQLVFRMGLSPVAHAFRGGQDRQLRWVIPQVPDHLRTLVYSTSRLINEFQETLVCLQHGRGDFVKVFTLLNPETMLEMINRFSEEMQNYTQQLRDANGRFSRTGPQRARRTPGARSAVPDQAADSVKTQGDEEPPAPVDAETTQKPRKATPKTRTKAQTPPAESAADAAPDAESAPAEIAIGEATSQAEAQEAAPAADAISDASSAQSAQDALAAFGFDVLAVAAETGTTPPEDDTSGDSGK